MIRHEPETLPARRMHPVARVRVRILGSGVALAITCGAAAAQPPEAERPEQTEPVVAPGEVIVVTGSRVPRPADDAPAATTVIDQAAIDRTPARLTDDLLRTLPSVGTFRRSSSVVADPTSQGLNLRGVGPSAVSRALVLRDGVPVNDPFGGWVYWRAISPLSLSRVEVTPSGASALFGDYALGGVVDLVSRPIERREAQLLVAGGSLRTGRIAARATEKAGELGVAVEGEVFDTAGYAPIAPEQRGAVDGDAASRHGNVGLRVEHTHGPLTTHVTARWFRESLDAGTQFTTADVRTLTLGIGTKLVRKSGTLAVELFGGDHEFRQERARVAPDRSMATLSSRQRTPSNNAGASATYTTSAGTRHSIVFGLDAHRVEGTATDVLSPPMVEADTLVERSAGGEQRFAAVFAEDSIRLSSAVDVTAAVRLDGWQNRAGELALTRGSGEQTVEALDSTSELQLDPRVGILGRLSKELAVRGSVYRSFRAPTLNELYRPFQVGTVLTAANESLSPEVLWGVEAGPQVVVRDVRVRATGFYNRLDDAIGNITVMEPRPDGAMRQRQNFGTARSLGVELEAGWQPSRAWTVSAAHTFMHATVVDAPESPMLVGKWLAHDPRHRSLLAVSYSSARYADITVQARYLGPMFEDDLNTLPIGGAALIDARVARSLGHGLAIYVAGENLGDRRYLVGRAGVDTLGAPRTFEVGVRLDTYTAGSNP